MKSLRTLADYLLYLCHSQIELQQHQLQFSRVCDNPNELFRSLNQSRLRHLSHKDLHDFVSSYTFELAQPRLEGSNFKVVSAPVSRDALLTHGVDLLMKHYAGSSGQMLFNDFCWLTYGSNDSGVFTRESRVDKNVRRELLDLLQFEIQTQLNIESFKKKLIEETPDLHQTYKTVVGDSKYLTTDRINKLLNVHGMFIGDDALKIVIRLKGQLNEAEFVKHFEVQAKEKELKVFHSNIKKTNLRDSNISFGTPNKRTFFTAESSAKKHNLVLSEIKVKDFTNVLKTSTFDPGLSRMSVQGQTPQPPIGTQVLQKIAEEERLFERKKQNTLLDPQLDLQLVYDRLFEELAPILQRIYQDTSFTAFMRFLMPSTGEHPYLGFIRYNIDNKISENALGKIRTLLEEYEAKEQRIREIWADPTMVKTGINKEELFKSLSSDTENILREELQKLLNGKEMRLVMHRMDPLKTGKIMLQYFA